MLWNRLSLWKAETSLAALRSAAMVRVCEGRMLPRGTLGKTYLLRTLGNLAHEVWDVTEPSRPALLTTVLQRLNGTHKNWWECETGIAYLVSDRRPSGWRTNRMTKIYDLSDPGHPQEDDEHDIQQPT